MGFVFKKNKYDYSEIAKMVETIAKSPLKKTYDRKVYELYNSDSVTETYNYEGYGFNIIYSVDNEVVRKNEFASYISKYIIEYNGETVFSYNSSENTYTLEDAKSWYDQLKQIYSVCLNATEQQKALDDRKQKEIRENLKKQQKSHERCERISKIFQLFSNGYSDDKIIVSDVKCHYYEGTYDEYQYYSGTISLIDGTVVFGNNIYRPGMWENYVLEIIASEEERRRIESQQREEARKVEKARQSYLKQEEYKRNHAPIDDGKFFK